MFGKRKTDVLVVGAGPVGLYTAASLHARGVEVEIYDQDPRAAERSYALALHPTTLHLLDEIGLAQELVRAGTKVRRLRFYEGRKAHATVELEALGDAFPYVLVAPQSVLETTLEGYLRDKGVAVHRNHRIDQIEDAPEAVTVSVQKLDIVSLGYPVQISESVITKVLKMGAQFVVGADGYLSHVRNLLGVEYQNVGHDLTLEVTEFDASEPLEPEVSVVLDDQGAAVLWPIEGTRQRWSFEMNPNEAARPQGSVVTEGTREALRQRLRQNISERAPWYPADPRHVRWSTQVAFGDRLVSGFGRHRTWLVGDAAHLTSPVGVHSVNIGLREGHDLATRLANIIGAGAGLETMHQFEAERQMEWRRLLCVDSKVDTSKAINPWVKEHADRIVPCLPASGAHLDALLAQLGLSLS